ncbi:MAG: phytanoyl-CoA dioxygenase family protein [Phycisphaerales bacterium]|nr:phytanoyl-CoA dioxygenase family protein [Phycisphaerales bacterium]
MSAITKEQIAAYHRDGYVIARRMFDQEEITLLRRAAVTDRELDNQSFGRADGEGGTVRLSLWNHPGESIYGMFARCRRIVDSAEKILEGEVYHYHSKMILKDPKVGGAWAWHQDYGYWYHFGVLFPLLTSVSVAVDPATRENGCMQILKGSHLMGRLEHVLTGDQAGADMERVEEASKRLELVYCEMVPGDAMFFHCNLLHRSDQNRSDKPRWSLICCYNAARNDPYKEAQHPHYTPLEKVDDGAIKRVGIKRFEDDASEVAWLDPDRDSTARSLKMGEAARSPILPSNAANGQGE